MPGQILDPETGFHYNYHRYYDPRTGRYLTPDPIGLLGGINPYFYAVGNPINYVDPKGHAAQLLWPAVIVGLGIGAYYVYQNPPQIEPILDSLLKQARASLLTLDYISKLFNPWTLNENTGDSDADDGETCEEDYVDPLDDYPANPDEWNPPEGWDETPAGEKTGGRHRHWKGPKDELRKWDREGRHGGKKRGPHWHDPRYPGHHIDPTR